jgi:hypothetical protein
MLGRRGWISVTAILGVLAVAYFALFDEPKGFLRETVQSQLSKQKPGGTFHDSDFSAPLDGLEDVLGPQREYEDGFT